MDEEFYEARRSTLYTIKPIVQHSSNTAKSKSFSKALLESNFKFPRKPSVVPVTERPIHYITADKTTCRDCPCFKNEAPYEKPQKIRMCQFTPRTLYELACLAVDALPYPRALTWIPQEVANWISNTVGFPQYAACFLSNSITGRKLLLFEDPSMLPYLNIVDYEHMKVISSNIRRLYGMELIKFTRSIGLPPRKPPTHCTLFQMRTASPNSETMKMTKSDILRMLHIINPKPIYINHWDLIWYVKPEYPKTKFGRVKNPQRSKEPLPKHVPIRDPSYEAMVPRKFKIQSGISPDSHLIWVDTRSYPINKEEHKMDQKDKKKKKHLVKPIDTRLFPKKISSTGLTGHALALARRLQPRQKFFPKIKYLPDEVSRKSSKTSQDDNKEPVVVYQSKRM